MSITETRQEAEAPSGEAAAAGVEADPITGALGSSDHKTIGRLYVVFALLYGVGAWVLAALSSAHDAKPSILSTDTVNQVFTLSRWGLVLLFLVPFFLGLATYIVPLQVGAATVAFPRAAAAAMWTWALSGLLLIIAYAVNGGVAGGRAKAVDLAYLAVAGILVALMMGSVSVVTTVLALRTPGMRLERTPLFSWSMLVGASMWLLTFPVLLANIVLIYVDHKYGKPSDFGVADSQWKQLAWFFQQPQVFVFILPALGVIGDVIATTSRSRLANRGFMFASIGAFGILGFGAFAQDYFNPKVWQQAVFIGMGVLIVLPTAFLLAGWGSTAARGKLNTQSPMLASVFAAVTLSLAAFGSALFVIKPLRLQNTPTFGYGLLVLVIGTGVLAGLAGLFYWAPKFWGRVIPEGLSKLAAVVAVVGTLLAGLALCLLGFSTRFTGLADAADQLNWAAAIGAGVIAVGLVLALVALIVGARGPDAGDDPWGGQTLEWATASPPPRGNFGELALVTSPEPLLDEADEEEGA